MAPPPSKAPPVSSKALPADLTDPGERYQDLGLLGKGSNGEVRRSMDQKLNRVVAMKVLRADLGRRPGLAKRFVAEAQVLAQLEHPSIVPIHDLGQLADGRWFLTMKVVEGETLRTRIAALHDARPRGEDGQRGPFEPVADGWSLARGITMLAQASAAIGLAHARGVLHRDVKPDNIMVGDHGEVLVVDWGLSKLLHPDPEADAPTGPGLVAGTPAYMSPEQARGDEAALGPASDVWSLGAVLFALIYGRSPRTGDLKTVLAAAKAWPPTFPEDPHIPPKLVKICHDAMQMDPKKRPQDGGALSAMLERWIEGTEAQAEGQELLAAAIAQKEELSIQKRAAQTALARARASVHALRAHQDLEAKQAAWSQEDEAIRMAEAAEALELQVTNQTRLALARCPDLADAHALLATLYRGRAEDAERLGDMRAAREFRSLVAEHDNGQHEAFLADTGELNLSTTPEGSTVSAQAIVPRERRLQLTEAVPLGTTPLHGLKLAHGPHLLTVEADGHDPVHIPVLIPRGGAWRSHVPGTTTPHPTTLPPMGSIPASARYVPAGWFLTGGDPNATGALPRQWRWVEGFVMDTHPVTHQDYAAFLNDLTDTAGLDAATIHVPQGPMAGAATHPLYTHITSKGWVPTPRHGTLHLHLDAPVIYIRWQDAVAHATWRAARDGLPWRLPTEFEREKAARGVDGRQWPWGDFADPSLHCVVDSTLPHEGPPPVDAFHMDESPYGIRGMAGGVQEWCSDAWRPQGSMASHTTRNTKADSKKGRRTVRGGAWNLDADTARCASRAGRSTEQRRPNLGFRLCRTWPPSDGEPEG